MKKENSLIFIKNFLDKQLHIVSFDVPLPANYGGVIDVFYKIKALHEAGVKIILHCFLYGDKKPDDRLLLYCKTVHYYKRATGMQGVSFLRPYIVNSRKSESLLKNLNKDKAPILFEGLHTCYYLNHPALKERKKFVRAHNIEHEYYDSLAAAESKWWKRWYFKAEAKLLLQYEQIFQEAEAILTIADQDDIYFKEKYHTANIPAFHQNQKVLSGLGNGKYILYQGNLSVPENAKAVRYLIEHVFSVVPYPVRIAGSGPSRLLKEKIQAFEHIQLLENPSEAQMATLISEAHIHVLYTADRSGLKLKLLNALFQGRFVLANRHVLENKNLQDAALLAESPEVFIQEINRLWGLNFSEALLEKRKRLLSEEYSNEANAQKIMKLIFST